MCSGQCYGVKRVKARTTRMEILCFFFGSHMVAFSWLGGCLLWGNRLKSGVDGGGGYRIEIFYELDAVILGAAASLRLKH